MNSYTSLKLMREYSKCKNCGNENVGNGEGTININSDTFTRTCKCGWKVEVKEDEI